MNLNGALQIFMGRVARPDDGSFRQWGWWLVRMTARSDDGDSGSFRRRSSAGGNNQPHPWEQSYTGSGGCEGEYGGLRKALRQSEEAKIPLVGKNGKK
mmetsp:Transcript_30769/g.63940  ORF Transcript_30769/g.63940 Transcript_30769/m.63940 type:complete len:98 (+) Transcript_30769:66-359(+)